ncbi:CheR family methyltransferase [Rhizosaccharibacter radicis]|uniref:Protein-glutamate methyltransferase n=1 Tax=Rhizosaccharibacter radicis TaxID=2782605 RepID=A0ABT1VX61_9PROT|nr:protein-glutamate methyltransferase [Acetobacteraceae bacterium KSS12]
MPAEDAFGRLKALVIERTLHHYYEDKDALLLDRLRRRATALALDLPEYLLLLEDPASGPKEWRRLEAEITVGETFFFRFAEQFAALEQHVLPALIAARAAQKRLRIWSAGCSTGAEPYSIAILLDRLLGADRPDWTINILGSDINEDALSAARRGEYGDWSLRSLGEAERRQDFLPGADGRRWTIKPRFRGGVRFERLNLLSLLEGAAPLQLSDYDLILCRNVLIYFRPDMSGRLVDALAARLQPDGWLLLGHAEAGLTTSSALRPVTLAGTLLYRRALQNAAPDPLASRGPGPAAVEPAGTAVLRAPASAGARRPSPGAVLPPVPSGRTAGARAAPPSPASLSVILPALEAADAVRAVADQGRLDEAWTLCGNALAAAPLDAALHMEAGLLHAAMDRAAEAEAAFRRALYLCNRFAMAHYHLGLLLADQNRVGAARRAFAEAGRLARALPPDEPVPGGGRITGEKLAALAGFDWLSGREDVP